MILILRDDFFQVIGQHERLDDLEGKLTVVFRYEVGIEVDHFRGFIDPDGHLAEVEEKAPDFRLLPHG